MSLINSARKSLIRIGKILPFAICFVVCVSYCESLYAAISENYLEFHDGIRLNTPISFYITEVFEYDWLSVIVTLIISISIETCFWNRLAVLYLGLHLVFKWYINGIELDTVTICVLCTLNIIITSILVYKGLRRL